MPVIEHAVMIRASPQAVFSLVSRVEDFVRYSDAIKSITPLDNDRYRWVVRAAGIPLCFDVQITESIPPERSSWRSVTGIPNRGTYDLTPVEGGTRIHLYLQYDLENALLAEVVRQAGMLLIRRLAREIVRNVEAHLQSMPPNLENERDR